MLARIFSEVESSRVETKATFSLHETAIKNLEVQMGQLASQVNVMARSNLPSDTIPNPKRVGKEECNAINLRSGKVLPDVPSSSTPQPKQDDQVIDDVEEESVGEEDETNKRKQLEESLNDVGKDKKIQEERGRCPVQKFVNMFKQLHVNIPFAEALESMPKYAKFLKDVLSKKRRFNEFETVALSEECSAVIQRKLPAKLKDPGSFYIPCNIGTNFNVLDCEVDWKIPLILGRPFLATAMTLIDVEKDAVIPQESYASMIKDPLEAFLIGEKSFEELDEDVVEELFRYDLFPHSRPRTLEPLEVSDALSTPLKPSIEVPPVLELKPLPSHLKYTYLGDSNTLPVIISSTLSNLQEEKLLRVLREHKHAIGWTIADIKGISPSICMHKILLEDDHKTSIEHQRRLNPIMKEVVKKEILKWLSAGIVYPISDSSWMLDKLAGQEFFCFLDGYSGYNQIAITPEDQEKTTFTCPYGTFAFEECHLDFAMLRHISKVHDVHFC
ncbi:hypothetical protein K1719_024205 [Acacia pycnantha]|nr:hypothetical protein K1719_024205 [Acacia pycnantha]